MVVCVERVRNKNRAIVKYRLLDTDRKLTVEMGADELRNRMENGFSVHNLKLSRTHAILWIDNGKVETTKMQYVVQVRESRSIYRGMVKDSDKRALTNKEIDALDKIGGFYVTVSNGESTVANIPYLIREAIEIDLMDTDVFGSRPRVNIKSIQKVNPDEVKIESVIDSALSDYKYIVRACIQKSSRIRYYRLLFNEKLN